MHWFIMFFAFQGSGAESLLGVGAVIKDSLFGKCHDHTPESHILQLPDSSLRLGPILTGTELLVERLLQNTMENGIAVHIQQKASIWLRENGHHP